MSGRPLIPASECFWAQQERSSRTAGHSIESHPMRFFAANQAFQELPNPCERGSWPYFEIVCDSIFCVSVMQHETGGCVSKMSAADSKLDQRASEAHYHVEWNSRVRSRSSACDGHHQNELTRGDTQKKNPGKQNTPRKASWFPSQFRKVGTRYPKTGSKSSFRAWNAWAAQ